MQVWSILFNCVLFPSLWFLSREVTQGWVRLLFWINHRMWWAPLFLISISLVVELSFFVCASLLSLWSVSMLCCLLCLLNSLLFASLVPFLIPDSLSGPILQQSLHTAIQIPSLPFLPVCRTHLIVSIWCLVPNYIIFSLVITLGKL